MSSRRSRAQQMVDMALSSPLLVSEFYEVGSDGVLLAENIIEPNQNLPQDNIQQVEVLSETYDKQLDEPDLTDDIGTSCGIPKEIDSVEVLAVTSDGDLHKNENETNNFEVYHVLSLNVQSEDEPGVTVDIGTSWAVPEEVPLVEVIAVTSNEDLHGNEDEINNSGVNHELLLDVQSGQVPGETGHREELGVIEDETNEIEVEAARGSRKRKRNTHAWRRKQAKMGRNLGQEYTNRKNETYRKREPNHKDCSKCKLKCSEKISFERVSEIHKDFWSTGSYERQRDFICQYVQKIPVVRRRKSTGKDKARRNFTLRYSLPEDIQVCKHFFLNCLDIGEKTVQVAKKKEMVGVPCVEKDNRGCHPPSNKTNNERIAHVKRHIESFPVMESHYCRSKTKRLYLSTELNITKLYELYVEKCEAENVTPVKKNVYSDIFVSDYNLSFHRPKKDTCRFCTNFRDLNEEYRTDNKAKYDQHLKNKELARVKKANDKDRAKKDKNFLTVSFDLQAVLYTPCSNVSSFFYTLKLCSYNLTIYNPTTKEGNCYFWTETDGKRGSDEIGTCLLKFLVNIPENINEVSFYSDSCGGQNRNRFIAMLLYYIVQQNDNNLQVIEHNFLETGHTEMEVDAMHSTIERNKKHQSIFIPLEWPIILRSARRKNPYKVETLTFTDFFDLKELKTELTGGNLNTTAEGATVNWMAIKTLRFEKSQPEAIFAKFDYAEEEYVRIPLQTRRRKGKKVSTVGSSLKQKYTKKLPISDKKKNNLLTLCRKNDIKPIYHDYYSNLVSSSGTSDRLPEPNNDEEDETV